MKFFDITLALAVLTGTWGSVLRDEPNFKLEKLVMQLGEDVRSLARTVEQKSELAMRLIYRITHTYDSIWTHLVYLREELHAEFGEALILFFDVPHDVVYMVGRLRLALQVYGEHDFEELKRALQSALGVYTEPVLERVVPYAETVRGAIFNRTQEIILKMDEKILQQMDALKPQPEEYLKLFLEYYISLEPYFAHTKELIRKGAETVHKHLLKPCIAPTLAVYYKYTEDLRGWPALPRQP